MHGGHFHSCFPYIFGKHEGKKHFQDLDMDEAIILKLVSKRHMKLWTKIHVSHNRLQWRYLVNTVIKFRVSRKAENFLTT
jgi:hypothetical protein